MTSGFRVKNIERRAAPEWVDKFKTIPVANISDSMSRLVATGAAVRPLHRPAAMCGPAITVKTRPGDNLMVHMALNLAKPGDVIVVDAGGDLTNAIVGERMLAYCVAKHFAGMVIHGAVRDYGWIRQQDFPVYAAGVTHRGPYKNGPGEINASISFGGLVIAPGDLIVGDEDGIVSVPFDELSEIHEKAAAKFKHETETFGNIGKGDNDASGYRKKLLALGCVFDDDA